MKKQENSPLLQFLRMPISVNLRTMENKHVALVALIERKIKTGRPGKVALEIVGELAKAWADGYNTSALEEGFGPYPPTRWLLRDALIARGYLPPDAPLDLEST